MALGALPFKGEMNFSNNTNNPLDWDSSLRTQRWALFYELLAHPSSSRQLHLQRPQLYVQDDWKVNKPS